MPVSQSQYDIGPAPPDASAEVIQLLSRCETATLGHWRLWGLCRPEIQAMLPRARSVGRAITVAIPGPCSTLLHYAVDTLKAGDVLVVDRLGDNKYACIGGGVVVALKSVGAVGAILDGPCTDVSEIREAGFPFWCRGVSPTTTRQLNLGGRLNRPVSIGGVVVSPGDYVLADESGVAFLSAGEAEQEARRVLDWQRTASGIEARIAAGEKLSELSGARRLVETAGALKPLT
jgi:4-hydroxy-4-methyl-2-oxoglutarate aldolase